MPRQFASYFLGMLLCTIAANGMQFPILDPTSIELKNDSYQLRVTFSFDKEGVMAGIKNIEYHYKHKKIAIPKEAYIDLKEPDPYSFRLCSDNTIMFDTNDYDHKAFHGVTVFIECPYKKPVHRFIQYWGEPPDVKESWY